MCKTGSLFSAALATWPRPTFHLQRFGAVGNTLTELSFRRVRRCRRVRLVQPHLRLSDQIIGLLSHCAQWFNVSRSYTQDGQFREFLIVAERKVLLEILFFADDNLFIDLKFTCTWVWPGATHQKRLILYALVSAHAHSQWAAFPATYFYSTCCHRRYSPILKASTVSNLTWR